MISEIEEIKLTMVTYNGELYRRLSSDCWEKLYGESWESYYNYEQIEIEYQEYIGGK